MSSHYVPHTRIPTLVFPSSAQASRHVALMIESLIRQNNSAGQPTILGLPTGRSGRLLHALRAVDTAIRRHRLATAGHRPDGPYRLQRAGLDPPQPDPPSHA